MLAKKGFAEDQVENFGVAWSSGGEAIVTYDKRGEMAGQEFGRMYDTLASGGTIGGFLETACVLNMIEQVKKG